MGSDRVASNEEVNALVQASDTSKDGKISKPELFVIFQKIANQWLMWKTDII